jgi:type 1 glutamine amidotransferase
MDLILSLNVIQLFSSMHRNFLWTLIGFILLLMPGVPGLCHELRDNEPVKVLILSGKNNHEWQKTTPVLIRIFQDPDIFSTQVTNAPDTLTFSTLKKFDVIVSNWNYWPDSSLRLSNSWENDFLRYVEEGGGLIAFHAGATSFYSWEAYHQIGIGRWGIQTSHGIPTRAKVSLDQNHPITRGMQDFYIKDEIWERTDIYPGVNVLGFLTATDETDGHSVKEPAVFVSQTGKGRSFYTILGHDERALLNSGLQAILQRAAQWCAHREVTVRLPSELMMSESKAAYQFRKPYFHPLTVNSTILSCVSPPDHTWHLGLWFSWKFINGVNYWEYLDDFRSPETGYKSEGITKVEKISMIRNPDFSADIQLNLIYHPDSFAWYVIRDEKIPFWYFSPAVLFDHNIVLKKGQTLNLSYRIWMFPGANTTAQLQEKFDQYIMKHPCSMPTQTHMNKLWVFHPSCLF